MDQCVLPFDACTAQTAGLVGGKALGLGELQRGGFPVPPGFAITTAAYRASIAPIALEIASIVAITGGVEANEHAAQAIAALFAHVLIPLEIAGEIDAAYASLGANGVPVAVRSSATAEDTANASFAGQQETYLWICGATEVRRSVVRCWASLFTARAITYRARLKIPLDGLAMGVVIQRMVQAEAAGVMMTLEPVSGDRSEIYIESAFGFGEAIVRGEVEPDRFHIVKDGLAIRSTAIARKEHAYRLAAGSDGVERVAVPQAEQQLPSLDSSEVVALANIGSRIERAFGGPMDIEWAIATNAVSGARELLVLQARPETVWSNRARVEAPEEVIGRHDEWDVLNSRSDPGEFWTTSNIGEAAPGVQTPLSWTVWWPIGEDSQREAAYLLGAFTNAERRTPVERKAECFNQIFYGRLAMRLNYLAMLGDRMPGTTGAATVQSLFGRVPEEMRFQPTRRRYPMVMLRLIQSFMVIPGRLRRVRDDYNRWWRQSVAAVPTLELGAATQLFLEAKDRFADAQTLQIHAVLGTVQPMYAALDSIAKSTRIEDGRRLGGVSGNAEMAVVCDLWQVSRGRMTIDHLIANHGFHGPAEGELSSRVWREDPAPLQRMAAQYAGRSDALDPLRREDDQQRERDRIEARVIAATPWRRRWIVRLTLKTVRKYLPYRGVAKRSFLQAFDVMRACARRIGELRATAADLTCAEDIFYLTVAELGAAWRDDARGLIAKRSARRAAYERLTFPANWQGMPDVQPVRLAIAPKGSDVIQGIGVSRGVVEGRARVLTHPDFAQVEPDEILVAPTTDPSWSSVMFISSALIVDIGGALSHAAVVAREMNIPCVVNTRNGTALIRSGDRLRVDGETGVVDILERHSGPSDKPVAEY